MSFHHFPSHFVFWDKVENHEELKKEYLPTILEQNSKIKNNPFGFCKFNTSFCTDSKMKHINNFLHEEKLTDNVIWKPLFKMLDKYNSFNLKQIIPTNSIIESSWWNVYEGGEFQEIHSHVSNPIFYQNKDYFPTFSIIYIMNDENEKSSIAFKSGYPNPFMPTLDDYHFDTSTQEDIKEGTVLIFSSILGHLVKPCIKPGRVTIAYNIYSIFE
jgi:hypothetical protein